MSQDADRPKVTRDVEAAALRDLMESAPRASVAFTGAAGVELLPARAQFRLDRWLFAVVAADSPDLEGREVVAAIDDGPYWFELRGISVRGVARRSETPEFRPATSPQSPAPAVQSVAGLTWYRIEATRILAWDYGALRRL